MADVKLYSVKQANRLLPVIRAKLKHLRHLQHRLAAHQNKIDVERVTGGSPRPFHKLLKEFHRLGMEFHATLESFYALGIEMKDLNEGLVDFYTLRDGQLAFLCWKDGERSITHWHTLESGYAGRQILSPHDARKKG